MENIENFPYKDFNEHKDIACDGFKENHEENGFEQIEQEKTKENSYFPQSDMLLDDSNLDVMLCTFLPIQMQHRDSNVKEEIKQRSELQTKQNDKNLEQNTKINESVSKKYSNRRDVVYKNVLRGTRRYLWTKFSSEHDCSKLSNYRSFGLYKEYIDKFYDTHFRVFCDQNSEEYHLNCTIIMSIIISEKYSYPSKQGRLKKISSLFKTAIKRYSRTSYTSLFSYKFLSEFFKMLIKSKTAVKIVESNQSMEKFKDKYEMVFDNIANFATEQNLLPNEI